VKELKDLKYLLLLAFSQLFGQGADTGTQEQQLIMVLSIQSNVGNLFPFHEVKPLDKST